MTEQKALMLALEALENIAGLSMSMYGSHVYMIEKMQNTARAAIKEALAQPEQEPVGEIVDAIEGAFKCSFTKMLPVGTKLYTTPPQRTWVGLTDEELSEIIDREIGFNSCWGPEETFARAIEAKLREKNA